MTKRRSWAAVYVFGLFAACHYDGCTLEWKGCTPITLVPLDLAAPVDSGDKGPGTIGVLGDYRFVGAATAADPSASDLHPVATLGQQSIRYSRLSASATVENVTDSGGIAASGNATIAHVVGVAPPGGKLELRVANGALIDAVFVPVVSGAVSQLLDGNVSGRAGAVLRDGDTALRVALLAGASDVVDESLTVEVTGGVALPEAWYHHRLSVTDDAATTLHVAVHGDGFLASTVDYAVVDDLAAIDGLEAVGDEPLVEAGFLPGGASIELCPYATSGDYEIIGVTPKLVASGAVVIGAPTQPARYNSCVTLAADGVGVGEVVLSLGALTRRYTFFVGSSDLGIDLGASVDMSQVD